MTTGTKVGSNVRQIADGVYERLCSDGRVWFTAECEGPDGCIVWPVNPRDNRFDDKLWYGATRAQALKYLRSL